MANPAFSEKVFGRIQSVEDTSKMTINGTINKSGILVVLAVLGASLGWSLQSPILMIGTLLINVGLAFAIITNPPRAAFLSQPYALIEGVLLGSISSFYSLSYPGIVTNALMLTFSVLILMLGLYRFKIIQVTDKLKSIVMSATMAIGVTYLISILLGFFGIKMPLLHDSSLLGIAFSVLVVGVAAFNLLLDFDMIERAEAAGSPKFMEWYGGFALLVTLVWLYLEILRLLSKLSKR